MMRSRWFGFAAAARAAVASAWAYPRLPPRVAIHWTFSGVPDGYSSKLLAAAMLPLMILGTRALLVCCRASIPRATPTG